MAPSRSDDRRRALGDCLRVLAMVLAAAGVHLAASGVHGIKLKTPEGAENGQLVMVEEQTFELVCESEKQPEMSYPQFPGTRPEMMAHRFPVEGGGYRWNFTLRVARALRQHTGYYTCSAYGTNDTDSVYIYVRSADGQNPWVKDADALAGEEMMGLYAALLNTTATLDCRPNDPVTQVHLVDKTGKTMSLGTQPDGSELTWDPRVGFRLGPVSMEHSGTYKCVVDEHHPELKLKLLAVASRLIEPTVSSEPPNSLATLGSSANLTCELATSQSLNFELHWQRSRGEDPMLSETTYYEHFASVTATKAWHRHMSTLHIPYVRAKDAGSYVCTAKDEHGNKKSAALNLQVRTADGPIRKSDMLYDNTNTYYAVSGSQRLGCAFNVCFTALLSSTISFLLRK